MNRYYQLLLLLLILCLPNVVLAKGARDAWRDVLKGCAESDLLGRDVLYLGPTNTTGPGSVLRKRPDKGYGIRWVSSDMNLPKGTVKEGNLVQCKGNSKRNFELGVGLNLENAIAPIAGALSLGIKNGRSVTLTVTGYRWDSVVEGPYESWVNTSAAEQIRKDLQIQTKSKDERRKILLNALAVQGFVAEVDYDPKVGAEIKGKIPEGSMPASNLGFNASVKWEGTTKMTISSEGLFYVAGDMANYGPTGISGNEPGARPRYRIERRKITNLEKETAEREAQ